MGTAKKTKSVIKSVKKNLKKKDYEIVSIKIKKIPKKSPPKKKAMAKVLNPVSGRLIIKGGPRFIELLEQGYSFRIIRKKVKTRIAGYLVPPETVVKTIAKKQKVSVNSVKNEINNRIVNEVPKQNAREKLGSALGGFASGVLSGGANAGEESKNNKGASKNNNTGAVKNNNTGAVKNNNVGAARNNMGAPRNNMGAARNNMGAPRNNNVGAARNNMGAPRNNMSPPSNQIVNANRNRNSNNKKGVGVIGQEGVTQVSNQNGNGGLVKNNGSNRPEPVERKPENLTEIKRNNAANIAKITTGEGAVMGKPQEGFKQKEPEKNNAFDKMLVKEGSKINS